MAAADTGTTGASNDRGHAAAFAVPATDRTLALELFEKFEGKL
jgi:hypothetical protein